MLIFVYHNSFKLYCILWASYLFIQGKESELQEIENILQGTNIKELLKKPRREEGLCEMIVSFLVI